MLFVSCPECTEVSLGTLLLVPPAPSSNRSYEQGHGHNSLTKKHEIHYEFLDWLEVKVVMLQVQFELRSQKAHKSWVPNWHNSLYLVKFFELLLLNRHGLPLEIPSVFFSGPCNFYVFPVPLLSYVLLFLPCSPFPGESLVLR
jgi:hypothetical protein